MLKIIIGNSIKVYAGGCAFFDLKGKIYNGIFKESKTKLEI
jgi:hypothetical protein